MSDTVLIVDDEESVRRTFQERLTSSGPGARVTAHALSIPRLKESRIPVRSHPR